MRSEWLICFCIEIRNLLLDFKILLLTVLAVFRSAED
ncbi:Uncharacterised protein [Mycolicibacterium vanbaalenii]|uniref:Uncharacterized protein n=1 Tax=Mycolicibacterium vanbaalenii TaxID=110539 RepID=A0A5S9R2H9_MYCVN|nr:Uncharacterised protein [Mycolicibacterium vanbaalenii]